RVVLSKYAVPVRQEERAEQGMPHDKKPSQPELRYAASARNLGRGQPKPAKAASAAMSAAQAAGSPPGINSPGLVVERNPWQFVGLMLFAGMAAGALFRFRFAVKILRRVVHLSKSLPAQS